MADSFHQRVVDEDETVNTTASWSDDRHADGDDVVDLDVYDMSFFVPSSSYVHNSSSSSDFESASEIDDSSSYPNCLYGDDQMNFVTNLFESRHQHLTDDDGDDDSNQFSDSVNDDVQDLGLGFEGSVSIGLRVVGIESDSDTEDVYDDDGTVRVTGSDYPRFWDCDDHRAITHEEFDWENVDGRTDDREGLTSMINRIEEISVSSGMSSDGEGIRALEWELLLAINNLERHFEFENDVDGYADTIGEYGIDTIVVGQIVGSESGLKGSPPAAKSFVDSLPFVVLTKEDVMESGVVCAVCKDDISVGEEAAQLPCCHHYHGECIVPWLSIRNTCPVCRFELPTDDADYEQRKNRRDGGGLDDLHDDSQGWEFWVLLVFGTAYILLAHNKDRVPLEVE